MLIKDTIKEKIIAVINDIKVEFKLDDSQLPNVNVLYSDDIEKGDYSSSICMQLAKVLKKSPLDISKIILEKIDNTLFKKIDFVMPGFLNFYLNDNYYQEILNDVITKKDLFGKSDYGKQERVLVEHTSVNPNKALHIGHLRNSLIGDSLAKIFCFNDYKVNIENYIDDTGVQVADIVTGLLFLDVKYDKKQKFDHFCWDVYTKVQIELENNEELVNKKRLVQEQLEKCQGEYYDKSVEIVNQILKDHLESLSVFDVFYDFYFSESAVFKTGLWEYTKEQLVKDNHLVFEKEGINNNCYVVKDLDLPNKENMKNPDKIMVTSKGNVTYTAKDLAHHFWKSGLVKNINFKKLLTQKNNQELFISEDSGEIKNEFYGYKKLYNVVDIRQAYNFDVIKAVYKKIGEADKSNDIYHVGYGFVSLSKDTMKQLGLDYEDDKNVYHMSGRKGIGVKVDDLVEVMTKKVLEKQAEVKNTDDIDNVKQIPAIDVAVGAIKAYILKFNLNNNIVFDINEALRITGDSGPYMQYTHARIKGILRKLDLNIIDDKSIREELNISLLNSDEEKKLLKKISLFPLIVLKSAEQINISVVYNYLIELCQDFNTFYSKHSLMKADNNLKNSRAVLIAAVAIVIKNGLSLLGIKAPERM